MPESLNGLEDTITKYSIYLTIFASAFVLIVITIAGILKNETERQKIWMFWSIAAVSAFTTLSLIGMTLYLNFSSFTKGPVHWHAGFEFFACGERLDLADPTGLSSKTGTPTLHEHNDYWIHLEGVPVTPADASFGKFLRVVDVELSDNTLSVPTNDGRKTVHAGDLCGDKIGEIQAFIYTTDKESNTYSQVKFANMDEVLNHVIRDESQVPPGDCLIVYFGEPTDRLDNSKYICEQYFHAEKRGAIKAGAN